MRLTIRKKKLNKNANMQKLLKTALHALTSNDEILDSMEYVFIVYNTILVYKMHGEKNYIQYIEGICKIRSVGKRMQCT